jgi:hypothetical protein
MMKMGKEHPIEQAIHSIQVPCDFYGNPIDYVVGRAGVTRIEACMKPGEYCYIPYVRVWAGDTAIGEFCQHKLSGLWFFPSPTQAEG